MGQHPVGQRLGDAAHGDDTAGAEGQRDQQADGGRLNGGVVENLLEGLALLLVLIVLDEVEDRAVDHADRAGFGGGEDAGVDAAEDDDGHDQGRQRVPGLMADVRDVAAETAASGDLLLRLLAADDPPVEEDRAEADGETGNNRRHPYLGDGEAGGQGIEDAGGAGRDQDAEEAGGCGEGRGIGLLIAALCHLFDHDLANGGEGGGGRAGQQTEGHAGQRGDRADAAADLAHEGVAPVNQRRGDAAVFHENAGQDEGRDRKEGEAVHGREGGLQERGVGVVAEDQQRDAADADAEGHVDLQEETGADEHDQEQEKCSHRG